MKKLTAQIMRIQLKFADTIRVDKYGKIRDSGLMSCSLTAKISNKNAVSYYRVDACYRISKKKLLKANHLPFNHTLIDQLNFYP